MNWGRSVPVSRFEGRQTTQRIRNEVELDSIEIGFTFLPVVGEFFISDEKVRAAVSRSVGSPAVVRSARPGPA